MYTLHVLCACYASAMCVGQIHKRDRTIDRVRVNGFKMVGTDCKDLIQSGG